MDRGPGRANQCLADERRWDVIFVGRARTAAGRTAGAEPAVTGARRTSGVRALRGEGIARRRVATASDFDAVLTTGRKTAGRGRRVGPQGPFCVWPGPTTRSVPASRDFASSSASMREALDEAGGGSSHVRAGGGVRSVGCERLPRRAPETPAARAVRRHRAARPWPGTTQGDGTSADLLGPLVDHRSRIASRRRRRNRRRLPSAFARRSCARALCAG